MYGVKKMLSVRDRFPEKDSYDSENKSIDNELNDRHLLYLISCIVW